MDNMAATGYSYPLRIGGLLRDISHLSSYGSGLERSHRRYMR